MKLAVIVLSLVYGFSTTPTTDPVCDDLKAKAEVTHTSGGLDNGSVKIEVEGGEGPYSFFFLNEDYNPLKHDESKNDINNLGKSKIKYIVRDRNDCFVSEDLIIE